jgi:pimeloyl-ACP methyl ester carboxylesterase
LLYCQLKYGLDLREASPEARIGQTRTPILLIHGLADSKTPPEHSRILATRNPWVVLCLVPGPEHTSAWSTAPAEFERRVLEWFAY